MKLGPSKQGAAAEKRVATLTGGRTRPASGALWFAKGDVATKNNLMQVKTTKRKQYNVRLKDLQTLETQALACNKEPVFILEFDGKNGRVMYAIQKFYGELIPDETRNHTSGTLKTGRGTLSR
jgi:hypothetical protein